MTDERDQVLEPMVLLDTALAVVELFSTAGRLMRIHARLSEDAAGRTLAAAHPPGTSWQV